MGDEGRGFLVPHSSFLIPRSPFLVPRSWFDTTKEYSPDHFTIQPLESSPSKTLCLTVRAASVSVCGQTRAVRDREACLFACTPVHALAFRIEVRVSVYNVNPKLYPTDARIPARAFA